MFMYIVCTSILGTIYLLYLRSHLYSAFIDFLHYMYFYFYFYSLLYLEKSIIFYSVFGV